MERHHPLTSMIERLTLAIERLAPPSPQIQSLKNGTAFVWNAQNNSLCPVEKVSCIDDDLLLGIARQKKMLFENSLRFAEGFPANNALLWGVRGTGKSSLIKAIHNAITQKQGKDLALVEIHREDISSLSSLLEIAKASSRPVIIFCDDLSFDQGDSSYKSLKAILDGGIEGRPDNVIFYATSNRRHLMARDMAENEKPIHASEAVEENLSLSDRFGLWIGFHNVDQQTYLDMIKNYIAHYAIPIPEGGQEMEAVMSQAREWSVTRGCRSGRVAYQFIQDLAGRYRVKIRSGDEQSRSH